MHYYEVAPIKIIRTDSKTFTYEYDSLLDIGKIVNIEVGKNQIVGVVIQKVTKPKYPTKLIASIIEETPLPKQLVDLALWMSDYYVCSLALVLQTILPSGLQKKRKKKYESPEITKRKRTNNVLNVEQKLIIKNLNSSEHGTFLLQGITGSGKTEVYISICKHAISIGESSIILVPEIALTSQLISEFSNHFKNLVVTHSKMTESTRHLIWEKALLSSEPYVVIGPRSALFTPIKNIGVVIVDEAHEPSYKQEQSPKYSALRAATMLGRFHKAKVIFGSATPNVTDRYLAERSGRPILSLTKVARKNSVPPSISIVDMKKRLNFKTHRFFSNQLLEQILNTLQAKKQVLIFHNRRGSATTTLCQDCGWAAECPTCFLPLSLHGDSHILNCHICGYKTEIPTSCPVCSSVNIIHKGIGTKIIESELRRLFPKANIARFDTDNNNEDTINSRYPELYSGEIDIAIGTQIVAKGLDLPHLRTVGVIQADAGLSIPDFNTNERTFQLLAQVIGRVGRNEHQTNVIIQTYQTDHPSIIYGIAQDYESFYVHTLGERKKGLFPPFTYLLKLTCIYKSESAAIINSQKLARELISKANSKIKIFGPTPSFYERRYDTYRWQLTLKSPKREYLIDALKLMPSTHWQYELDPTSLL
ncbi:MAG: primosomal protein N' [Candidatus Saccharibacteria bacterium]